MTREEAKGNLIHAIRWNDMAKKEALDVAIKAIDQTRWIPCSERLPEERGGYIVTEKVFNIDDREHKGRYNTMVEQVEYHNGKWQRASFFEVVAWMPLPEPYKQEVKNNDTLA